MQVDQPVSTVKLEHNKSKLWQNLIISFPTTFFSWPLFYSDLQINSRCCSSYHPIHIHSSLHFTACTSAAVASGAILIWCVFLCPCFPSCHGSVLTHPTLTAILPSMAGLSFWRNGGIKKLIDFRVAGTLVLSFQQSAVFTEPDCLFKIPFLQFWLWLYFV